MQRPEAFVTMMRLACLTIIVTSPVWMFAAYFAFRGMTRIPMFPPVRDKQEDAAGDGLNAGPMSAAGI